MKKFTLQDRLDKAAAERRLAAGLPPENPPATPPAPPTPAPLSSTIDLREPFEPSIGLPADLASTTERGIPAADALPNRRDGGGLRSGRVPTKVIEPIRRRPAPPGNSPRAPRCSRPEPPTRAARPARSARSVTRSRCRRYPVARPHRGCHRRPHHERDRRAVAVDRAAQGSLPQLPRGGAARLVRSRRGRRPHALCRLRLHLHHQEPEALSSTGLARIPRQLGPAALRRSLSRYID